MSDVSSVVKYGVTDEERPFEEEENPEVIATKIVEFVNALSYKGFATFDDIETMGHEDLNCCHWTIRDCVMELLGQGRIFIHEEDLEKIRFVPYDPD